jgi:hypothetical protein
LGLRHQNPVSFSTLTQTNLDYVGPIADIKYFGVDEMGEGERKYFMSWYDEQKDKVFNYRRVLEEYRQDDVTVLRQAYQFSGGILWKLEISRFS